MNKLHTSFVRISTEARDALRDHCARRGLVIGVEASKAILAHVKNCQPRKRQGLFKPLAEAIEQTISDHMALTEALEDSAKRSRAKG